VPYLIVIVLSVVGVGADMLLKKASSLPNPVANWWFAAGALIFATTAFGWVYAMKYLDLGRLGAIYGSATILMLVLVGATLFNERLGLRELAGIACALASILLLSRFS